ncbi:MAG: hypothetical protein HQL87_09765 [Magnetococcales bacterium]|nr:hypothetical protein [Magnetococcales bacterium]
MKAIIHGKRFDTDKATLIGEAGSGGYALLPHGSSQWWNGGLYRTPQSGRFFLAGKGGSMTIFARFKGDNAQADRIIEMTKQEALEWAEVNLTAEVIEAAFADMIEDA